MPHPDFTPTGRWRHRTDQRRWWTPAVLVLQLEERFIHTYCVGGVVNSEWATRWRDAEITDLTETNIKLARLI